MYVLLRLIDGMIQGVVLCALRARNRSCNTDLHFEAGMRMYTCFFCALKFVIG